MNINIGGLYTYPELRELWDKMFGGESIGESISCNDIFVVLDESKWEVPNDKRSNLKILTSKGVIGWILCVDKQYLEEVKEP